MKKTIGVIFAVMLAFACGAATAYASQNYVIGGLGLTLELPDGWTVFTRNMDPGDKAFEAMGADKQTVDEFFRKSGIYLDAVSEDKTLEIAVSGRKNADGISDLSSLPETEKQKKLGAIRDMLAQNYTVTATSQYDGRQATFLCADMSASLNDETIYIREYATVINGSDIAITMCSYSGELTEESKEILSGVMESLVITEVLEQDEAPAASNAPEAGGSQGILGGSWVWDVIAGVTVLGCIIYLLLTSSKRKGDKRDKEGKEQPGA
ncbi:MAG: hypothetical protein ACM3S4_03985 [Burkholderiales bacterium]